VSTVGAGSGATQRAYCRRRIRERLERIEQPVELVDELFVSLR
jgi:hypothetical protein